MSQKSIGFQAKDKKGHNPKNKSMKLEAAEILLNRLFLLYGAGGGGFWTEAV